MLRSAAANLRSRSEATTATAVISPPSLFVHKGYTGTLSSDSSPKLNPGQHGLEAQAIKELPKLKNRSPTSPTKETHNDAPTTWTSFCKYVDEESSSGPQEGRRSTGKYEGTPDASFTFTDDDFLAITSGKLNLHMAFIRGKLKIKGSISTAQKFTPDAFPKPSKL
ncbi:hypothetical protein ZWY2020_020586 [Hordeum vulgare]|nr:hypothetical protein ZWY2020_020586 [Hordeum vulgare]